MGISFSAPNTRPTSRPMILLDVHPGSGDPMGSCSEMVGIDFPCGLDSDACRVTGLANAIDRCEQIPSCVGIVNDRRSSNIATLKASGNSTLLPMIDQSTDGGLALSEVERSIRDERLALCRRLNLEVSSYASMNGRWQRCRGDLAKSWTTYGCNELFRIHSHHGIDPSHASSGQSPLVRGCARILLGVFTTSKDYGINARFRRLMRFHTFAADGSLQPLGCGLNPILVTGEPAGPFNKRYKDTVVLRIRENMDGGKTFAWLRWAARNANDANFVMKMDTDTQICPDALAASIRDAAAAGAEYYGYYIDYDFWGEEARAKARWEKIAVKPHQGYMSGALYGLSMALTQQIVRSTWAENHQQGFEDLMTGLMVIATKPKARIYHLDCLYTTRLHSNAPRPIACPARHRQFNKWHASEKLLCEEDPSPYVTSCDCKWWTSPMPASLAGRPFCDLDQGSHGLFSSIDVNNASHAELAAATAHCAHGCEKIPGVGVKGHGGCFGNAKSKLRQGAVANTSAHKRLRHSLVRSIFNGTVTTAHSLRDSSGRKPHLSGDTTSRKRYWQRAQVAHRPKSLRPTHNAHDASSFLQDMVNSLAGLGSHPAGVKSFQH